VTPDQINTEAAAIVRRYRQLGAQMAELAEERTALQSRFRALVPVGYALDVDGKAASKTEPARSFDLSTAVEVARVIGLPVRYVEVADAADLKDRLRAIGKLDDAMLPGKGAEIVRLG
jgi:hypothetical protein